MHPLLKSTLGVIFTIEEDKAGGEKTKPAVTTNQTPSTQGFGGNQGVGTFTSPNFIPPVVDTSKFKSHFLDLMKKTNFPGNDYYELNMTLDALEGKIPDEKTKFIAAFTPLSLNGLTLQKINETANAYVSALDEDARNFNAAIEDNKKNSLGTQKNKINENTQKMQELQLQIQKLNEENINLNNQIADEERQINESKAGYEVEYNNMRSKILNDLNKANQYLQ